jgi:hypothetical protein
MTACPAETRQPSGRCGCVAQQPDRVVRSDMVCWVDALRLHVLAVLIVACYGSSRSPRPPRDVLGVPAPATPCKRLALTSDTETRRPSRQPTGANQLYRVIGAPATRSWSGGPTALRSPERPAVSAGYGLSNGGCPWRIHVSGPSREFSVSVGRGFTAGPGSEPRMAGQASLLVRAGIADQPG